MRVYHVIVEREDDWYVARALEDSAVFTQGRSFDEIIANIREVAELRYGERHVQIELVIPPEVGRRTRTKAESSSKRRTRRSAAIAGAK